VVQRLFEMTKLGQSGVGASFFLFFPYQHDLIDCHRVQAPREDQ
jgi:hypothetical protein